MKLVIPGKPVGKGRPRSTRRGVTYTPRKTRDYEEHVQEMYMVQCKQKRVEGPFRLRVTAYYYIPKSTSKVRKEKMLAGDIRPTKKPDIDNVVKTIADALNGIAFTDDNKMVEVVAEKFYSDDPRVEVQISPWLGGASNDIAN